MESTTRGPRPYLNPYLAGALLGVVLFLAFFLTGGGLGASGGLSHIQAGIEKWVAPGHVDRVGYLADMAGGHRSSWDNSGVYMLVGTVLGGLVSGLVFRRARLEIRKGPRISGGVRLALAFGGGLVMAYGARMARGCTSGQALSGGAVLSVGSWAFMFAVFGGGYAVAWFLRRLWT
ncbi:MAG TPA: YeeE/YedE thiosulfate transporter family protein [Anaeromyxobacter sp.]|nr:YeeE/YedE thiosulfate transporter family protein [Anaeromyxobacter sp.]